MSTDVPGAGRPPLGLVDHHCHGVAEEDLDRAALEDLITESSVPAPAGCSFFDTQLGLAIRAYCAPVLDLPAYAAADDYVARRRELGAAEVNRRLLRAGGFDTLLVETGHLGDRILSPAAMAERSGARTHEVVRLEQVAEAVAADPGVRTDDYPDAFRALLAERLADAVGVKTIAAYRHGLDFAPERPAEAQVVRAFAAWRESVATTGVVRLTDPTLIASGIWEAVDRRVPIQVHVGYGDSDIDLHRCNPLLMTGLIRSTQESGATFALLHCYPYHREAGYLTHVYPHVYCDVGLAINYTGFQSAQVIAESLELTPWHKALFSSDAWGAAELYHLGALLFRRGLDRCRRDWFSDQPLPDAEWDRIVGLIASGNARRLYALEG